MAKLKLRIDPCLQHVICVKRGVQRIQKALLTDLYKCTQPIIQYILHIKAEYIRVAKTMGEMPPETVR